MKYLEDENLKLEFIKRWVKNIVIDYYEEGQYHKIEIEFTLPVPTAKDELDKNTLIDKIEEEIITGVDIPLPPTSNVPHHLSYGVDHEKVAG